MVTVCPGAVNTTLGFVVWIVLGLSLTVTVVDPPPVRDPVVAEKVQPVVEDPWPSKAACHVTGPPPLLLRVKVGHALAVQIPPSVQVVPVLQT